MAIASLLLFEIAPQASIIDDARQVVNVRDMIDGYKKVAQSILSW